MEKYFKNQYQKITPYTRTTNTISVDKFFGRTVTIGKKDNILELNIGPIKRINKK